MRSAPLLPALVAACLAMSAAAAPADHASTANAVAAPASAELRRLLAAEWDRSLADCPECATYQGDHRHADRWSDLSPQAIERRQAADRAALAKLRAIDRAALTPDEQLELDSYLWQVERTVERQRFREWLLPVSHQWGLQTADSIVETMRFDRADDVRAYVARLRALPLLVQQTTALMRQGLAEGLVPPRVLMQRVLPQLALQVVDDPRASPWWRPFRRLPAALSEAERSAWQREGEAALREAVVPAYRAFQAFFADEYLPRTRAGIAATDRPDGAAYYDFLARYYTTTSMTAAQIHELGLAEVARLHEAMARAKADAGFAGTMPEFFHFLRTDPRFYCATPEELLKTYAAVAKRIDPELVKVFRRIPRLPYGVRAIPDNVAPNATAAYYQPGAADGTRPGYYYVNLYKPESRPTWEMLPLSLHEAVPGHHLQFARALEFENVSDFRRTAYFVAYGEGWALYAEQLGYEMGLYDDPYDRFGQLTYEMWRAIRLVVDTGMHARGWSREQAIRYFRDNSAKTEQDIVNEIDRYIDTPAQALAYKIGQIRISALRERATRELGARFDLRDFNDEVLATGSVPLEVLERRMVDWMAARRRTP